MTGKVILELNKWDDRRYEVEHQTAWGEWWFSASFITREAAIAGAERVLRDGNVNVRIIDTKEES